MTTYLPHIGDLLSIRPSLADLDFVLDRYAEDDLQQGIYAFSPRVGTTFEVTNDIDIDSCPEGGAIDDYIIGYTWTILSDNPDHESPWFDSGDDEDLIRAVEEARKD